MPDRIGKYEIRKLLGRGASGPVYLALDPFGQREVALKVFHNGSSHAAAALAGKVRHPHIVSVLKIKGSEQFSWSN
jgi:serine/threonine protein kinase